MPTEIIEHGAENPAELRRASPDALRIELNRPGGTVVQRALASIPATTEGKVQYLERLFGEGNVKTTPSGEILIPDPSGSGVLVPFDERNFTFKDITADLVGPAIPVAATLAAGTNPITVGGAAMAGEAARIGVAELLTGGETGQSRAEQLLDIGLSGILGSASQKLANIGARVFDAIRPRNFVVRQVRKAQDTPFARKGAKLEQETGIALTLGEQTGSRAVLMAESFGRRTPGAADTFHNFHQAQLRASLARLKEAMNKQSAASASGTFRVGSDITSAFGAAMDSALRLRSAQAAEDYALVHLLSRGQEIIPTKNLIAEMQRIVDELDVPGAGDATQHIVNQAKRTRDSLLANVGGTPAVRLVTAEQAQRLLQVYTNAQKGTGVIWKDMDRAQSRFLAGRLKDAFLHDLDDAVGMAGPAKDIADALRVARDRYRANSVAINSIADSTLARLIGNGTRSPEAIAEKFLRMAPSEIRSAVDVIDSVSPNTTRAIRRLFIEHAIERAKPPVSQQTASGVKFSASRFLSNLPSLPTMRAAGFSRQEIVEIGAVARVLERVADKAFEGSPTAFATIAWDALKGVFALNFNPVSVGQSAYALLAPGKIAKAVLTPEGRRALIELSQTSKPTTKTAQALVALAAITDTEPGPEDVRALPGAYEEHTEQDMNDVLNQEQDHEREVGRVVR